MSPDFTVRVVFWMWIMTDKGKAKKRVLHAENLLVEGHMTLSDIWMNANTMLGDFRFRNPGIVHSDIYCDWSVKSKTQ